MFGYDHETFWDQTPRTLSLTDEAFNRRLMREHNDRAWAAWHIAGLQRAKKLPPLRSLMMTQQQTARPDEQIAGLVRWVKATGGKVIYHG